MGVEATTKGEGDMVAVVDMAEATVVEVGGDMMVVDMGEEMEADNMVDHHPATPAGQIIVEEVEQVEGTEKDLA